MDEQSTAGILHISDLHLGKDFLDCGLPKNEILSAIKSYWKKGGLEMQAHDSYILTALKTDIQTAALNLNLPDNEFDFVVVTGDISTTADCDKRFDFAKQYLESSFKFNNIQVGLNVGKDSILCVPGNHDKLNETSLERYLKAFDKSPSQPPYCEKRTARNGLEFIFYGIDSNLYEEGNIAVGRITEKTFAWLSAQKLELIKSNPPDKIRVLLLHHHPCNLNRFRKRFFQGVLTNKLAQLEEADRLLELCNGWINIIMHGHEHFPIAFQDEKSGCVVVSAGSVSKRQNSYKKNSFHVLSFQKGYVEIVEFEWTGGRFRRKDADPHVPQWKFPLV